MRFVRTPQKYQCLQVLASTEFWGHMYVHPQNSLVWECPKPHFVFLKISVAELIEDMECTPSLSQSAKLKELSSKQQLDADTLYDVMTIPKANQKETLKLYMDKLRDFFPNCLPKDMEKIIFQILKDWKRNRERQRSFDREER